MIMFYISYGSSYVEGTPAWRIPWAVQAVPAILLFFALFFVPESPRWLAKKDRLAGLPQCCIPRRGS